ncbi:MAG: PspA/IM30 family protein [Thermodesulfobacteriota bacterium]
MRLMQRLVWVLRADLHGALDQLEDKTLLLKQYMREMEEELWRKEARLGQLASARDNIRREISRRTQEAGRLEENLNLVLAQDKDDLARRLIRKLRALKSHLEELERQGADLEAEVSALRDQWSEQRLKLDEIKFRAADYLRRSQRPRWETLATEAAWPGGQGTLDEEEVEIELLRRKESVLGGMVP